MIILAVDNLESFSNFSVKLETIEAITSAHPYEMPAVDLRPGNAEDIKRALQ